MKISTGSRMASEVVKSSRETFVIPEMKSSLVGPVGIEPTTCGLKVRCSTAELKALSNSINKGTTA